VALVRTDDRVPGQPVLLSESLVIHGPILNRAAELATGRTRLTSGSFSASPAFPRTARR
jgi:hypothetical protein